MHPFEKSLAAAWPPEKWQDVTVLAAVSGGPDSVALLTAVQSLRHQGSGILEVAHFNHGFRGKAAQEDERFVRRLCEKLGLPLHLGRGAPENPRTELSAREHRYRFLEETANRTAARYLITAHTADDQAETILHHIARDTRLRGGERIARPGAVPAMTTLVRPLLELRRQTVLEYLSDCQQPFRTDATNLTPQYTRNRIRNTILPLLCEQVNEAAVEAIQRLGLLAAEAQGVIDAEVDRLLDQGVTFHDARTVTMQVEPLRRVSKYLVREVFIRIWQKQLWPQQSMGFEQWNELADLIRSPRETARDLPGSIRLTCELDSLTLRHPS